VAGGVSFLFGDQLSDRQIGVGVQANGTVQDIGAQIIFQNLKHRWNYGASVQHVPYLTGYYTGGPLGDGFYEQDLVLQRIFIDEAGFSAAYPFSSTRRIEASLSATRLGFSTQIQQLVVDGAGNVYQQNVIDDTTTRAPIYYGQASVALVGDASYSAFTGPIQGTRYRFEVTPTVGTLNFTTLLADYRKYLFLRPITFAFRGLHYGRYGQSADDSTALYPLFLGEEQLMRGYSVGSFSQSECGTASGISTCPAFDRLLGSKLAVANFEIRIPVFGVPEYGLLNVPFLPLTLAPFVDVGVAWTGNTSPSLSSNLVTNPNYRTPVVSSGLSARFNVLGYAILEAYVAHPFQRPGKNWLWGFQLVPGW
jgi:Omp85 superfamily domain